MPFHSTMGEKPAKKHLSKKAFGKLGNQSVQWQWLCLIFYVSLLFYSISKLAKPVLTIFGPVDCFHYQDCHGQGKMSGK